MTMDSHENETITDRSPTFERNNNEPEVEDWYNFGFDIQQDIPTMSSVAQSVMKNKGIRLDSIQYVAYEIICASFFIESVRREMASF